MLPGKATKQNRDVITLLGSESPLHGAVKMCGLVQASYLAEPVALGLQALLDFFIVVDLHKIGRHYLPPAYAVFWSFGKGTRTDERFFALPWQNWEKQNWEKQKWEKQKREKQKKEKHKKQKAQKQKSGSRRSLQPCALSWLSASEPDVRPPETPKTCCGGSMFYARARAVHHESRLGAGLANQLTLPVIRTRETPRFCNSQ